jgi:hypothetical protein
MNTKKFKHDAYAGLKIFLTGMAAVFVIGAVVGYIDGSSDGPPRGLGAIEPAVVIGGAALVCILSLIVGVHWMQSIDELAQRAHYEAWYWGGSIALAVMAFVVLSAPALERIVDIEALYAPFVTYSGKAAGFMAGVVASVIALGLGYGAWWIVFWVRRR